MLLAIALFICLSKWGVWMKAFLWIMSTNLGDWECQQTLTIRCKIGVRLGYLFSFLIYHMIQFLFLVCVNRKHMESYKPRNSHFYTATATWLRIEWYRKEGNLVIFSCWVLLILWMLAGNITIVFSSMK